MTLLIIEMPILIIQAVEHAGGISQIYLSIGLDVMGYFLVSIVVYDIWSIQKSLFQATRSSVSQNLACISTLWLSTLIPPMLYVAEHFYRGFDKNLATTDFSGNAESLAFRTIAISIIFIIHLILLTYTTKKCVVIDLNTFEYMSRLLRLRVIALAIITPSSLILGMQSQHSYVLAPFFLFAPFLLVPANQSNQGRPR